MERWWDEPLAEVFDGRRVVVAGAVPAAWIAHVDQLRAAGATDVMVVATEGAGAGDGPDVPTVIVEPPADISMMERLRFGLRALADPPPAVQQALAEFDPSGEAVAVGSFLNVAPDLAGRPFLAHRRPEWVELEDKVVVDAFWDRAGVRRLPSTVAPLERAAEVAAELDRGAGTVWAADARDGFHGGGTHTHWVADRSTQRLAIDRLRPVCDRVRVMPFVDGVSCSIHGIVTPDGVAVLRPVEMVTLRRGRELVYAGCATFWDPDDRVREQMRDVAHRTGGRLDTEVGFRGTFTVDGVVDADGFWPTEVNPRFGAGINIIARSVPELPLLLLNDLLVAGRPINRSAAELEADLLEVADGRRGGGTWRFDTGARDAEGPLRYGADGWDWAGDGEPSDGAVLAARGYTRCLFDEVRTPVGPSVGTRAAAFWSFVNHELDAQVGQLSPPPE